MYRKAAFGCCSDNSNFFIYKLKPDPLGRVRVSGLYSKSFINCSFSLLAQRKRTKRKGTRAIWSFGLRCAPQSCREFSNSLRSNSENSLSASFPVLTKCQWGTQKSCPSKGQPKPSPMGSYIYFPFFRPRKFYMLLYVIALSTHPLHH